MRRELARGFQIRISSSPSATDGRMQDSAPSAFRAARSWPDRARAVPPVERNEPLRREGNRDGCPPRGDAAPWKPDWRAAGGAAARLSGRATSCRHFECAGSGPPARGTPASAEVQLAVRLPAEVPILRLGTHACPRPRPALAPALSAPFRLEAVPPGGRFSCQPCREGRGRCYPPSSRRRSECGRDLAVPRADEQSSNSSASDRRLTLQASRWQAAAARQAVG